jgi:hypothetical protein
MGSFRHENGEWKLVVRGEEIKLDEDNLTAHVHRETPLMDRVAVEDPADGLWWSWFRYSEEDEQFNQLIDVVYEVGTLVMSATASLGVEEDFYAKHTMTQNDFDELKEFDGGQ